MKIYSRLLFCILTKDPFVCFCLSFSWVKQSSPSYHDLFLEERAPLVHCSSVMLLFPFWDLFLWITMDHGWEHLQWNKPMTGMAEACHVKIIILMDDSAALSHFLEEIGWGKYGGRTMWKMEKRKDTGAKELEIKTFAALKITLIKFQLPSLPSTFH